MEYYDKETPVIPRPTPMKVLVLGLPRTATTSMCAAMKILGIRSYHWDEMLLHKNNRHMQLWLQAVRAKYDGIGKRFAGEDFDRMLWNYQAVSDDPCCLFVDELLAAYPDAKVILNTRDRETWLRSYRATVGEILSWKRSWGLLAFFDREFTAHYWAISNRDPLVLSQGISLDNPAAPLALREGFDKHHEHIRTVTPKDRLLEFHPRDGWEPLCKFLDMPIPAEEFPRLNEPKTLIDVRKEMYWSRWYVVVRKMVKTISMAGIVLATVLWITRRLSATSRTLNRVSARMNYKIT